MVVFDGVGEVYIASEVRACVPLAEQTWKAQAQVLERERERYLELRRLEQIRRRVITFEDESGFSDASGTVED